MTKSELLEKLREGLRGLPSADVERSVEYYNEIIEDKMEDGASEDASVAALGELDAIIADVRASYAERSASDNVKRVGRSVGGARGLLNSLVMSGYLIYNLVFYCVIISLAVCVISLGGIAIWAPINAIYLLFELNLVQAVLILAAGAFGVSVALVAVIVLRIVIKYGRLVAKWMISLVSK